jgi:gluconate transporter
LTVLLVLGLVALLVLLISWTKVPPFAAFLATSVIGALLLGMPFEGISKSIEHGVGDMLGGLAAIICLGAMFGRVIAESGAAQTIANRLVNSVGDRFILVALALTGLIVGIPLFYSVGFVVMVPLVFSLEKKTRLPAVYLGIPLLCGLSVAHGFLPPHPSPAALITIFGADVGLTLLYGLIVSVVAVIIAGPCLALTLKSIRPQTSNDPLPVAATLAETAAPTVRLPGTLASFGTALLPVILITAATALAYIPNKPAWLEAAGRLLAQPTIVLMISLVYATVSLGLGMGRNFRSLMQGYGLSLTEVSGILLVLAGAGAFKQVLVDAGVSSQLGVWLQVLPVAPLFLGWLIAVAIRVALGSATIAGITAAGIMAPVVVARHVDPNLMVLSVGAGSLMFSHVNDAGFWLFKEYFNLSLKDTFRSWTVMESLVGVIGLLMVLMLNAIPPMYR